MEENMTPPNQAADQTAREEPRSHAANAADDSQAVSRIGLGLAALGRPVYLTARRSDALGAPGDRSIEAMRGMARLPPDATRSAHHQLEMGIRVRRCMGPESDSP